MKLISLLLLFIPTNSNATLADTISKLQSKPFETSVANNNEIFARYCVGDPESSAIPKPKYDNPLVKNAADLLSKTKEVADQILTVSMPGTTSQHFYFYYPIIRIYKLSETSVPSGVPAGVKPEAHNFLTLLCGEFRDRATMIEAKVNWLQNLFILPNTPQSAIDPQKNIWSQVSVKSYYPYLNVTSALWYARKSSKPNFINVGTYQVDNPVQPMTVCETKYIFSEYVFKAKPFDNLAAFEAGYQIYSPSCPTADLEDYYDFRGDANFKHYSPEANAMIWYGTSVGSACKNPKTSKNPSGVYSNTDCENYFKRPFHYRFNAARAALATWLFRSAEYDSTFSNYGNMVAIYPHRQPELAPFSFSFALESPDDIFGYDENWMKIPGGWNRPDIGFSEWTGLTPATNSPTTSTLNLNLAYERLRDAVDRHTDWYSSGYNDKNGVTRTQAYSPFMATSYEMSESNNFVMCGYTVTCPNDGLKRWMFIFRVKAANWYNTARLANGEALDLQKMWLDETSFGNSGLANAEKAWDRMGTSSEDELESILYLVNLAHIQ